MRSRLAAFALLLSLAAHARAEDPYTNRGVDLNGVYNAKDVDVVNVFNGNVIVAVPLGAEFPLDGGFSYGIHLIYNGNPWDYMGVGGWQQTTDRTVDPTWEYVEKPQPVPNRRSNAGMGWRVSIGRLVPPDDPTNAACASYSWRCHNYMYESPDGANHVFYGDANGTEFQARDSSYLQLTVAADYRDIRFPNGMVHRFNTDGSLINIFTPYDIREGRTPSVIVEYATNDGGTACGDPLSSTCWKISDRFGRQQLVTFYSTPNLATGQLAHIIRLTAPGGHTVDYTLKYNNAEGYTVDNDVDLAFDATPGCLDRWTTPSSVHVPILTSIILPDASTYTPLIYSESPTSCNQGSLHTLTLPTAGTITYTYGKFLPNDGMKNRAPFVPAVRTRTVTDAAVNAATGLHDTWTWTYSRLRGDRVEATCYPSPCPPGTYEYRELAVTVTDPAQNAVNHYFSIAETTRDVWDSHELGLPFTRSTAHPSFTDPKDGQPRYLSTEVLNGAAVDRQVYVKYEGEGLANTFTDDTDRDWREQASITVYPEEHGTRWSSVVRSDFDGVGHYRSTVTDGNFHVVPDATTNQLPLVDSSDRDKRSELVHYVPPGPGEKWITSMYDYRWTSEQSHTRRTELCFERDTGFLQRTRVLAADGATNAQLAPGPNDVIAENQRDPGGNVISTKSYGGDITAYCTPGGTAAPTGALCTATLTAPRYEIHHTYQKGVRETSRYYSGGTALPFYTLGGVGKTATVVSGAATGGWMNRLSKPTPEQLGNFVSGFSANGSAGYWGGAGETWGGPGAGWATEVGVVSPQIGVSATWAWELPVQGPQW